MLKHLQRLFDGFGRYEDRLCLADEQGELNYAALTEAYQEWIIDLKQRSIPRGAVVALRTDYSIHAISLLLALYQRDCIVALIPPAVADLSVYLEDGQAEFLIDFVAPAASAKQPLWQSLTTKASHPLISRLRETGEPGFIIYSSGSTGHPKAILHSVENFLAKFDQIGKDFRTLAFLLFDHIAGQDTLLYTLASGGALVLTGNRNPDTICRLVEQYRVEVLPASPTFLNLLCLSHAFENYDLSSLKIITYGSEPMSQSVLNRVQTVFPNVRLIQKYGTSEFGSPRSRSRDDGSLWIQLKQDEIRARIVDDVLWVKTKSAMMGYLNADSPFDDEGWYCTGDRVEQDGDWIHILGRESELINVGGEKVFPQEVESVILEIEGISDCLVRGETHPLIGQMVVAEVECQGQADPKTLEKSVRKHCRSRLEAHKVPVKVRLATSPLASDRQKKQRR